MIRQLALRVVRAIIAVWFIATATFVVTTAIPADPVKAMLGPHADDEARAKVRAQYCLDRGAAAQYGCWLRRLARGDLGESYRSRRPVAEIIADRIWPTAQLALAALVLQLALGVPLGVVAAVRHRRWPDRGLAVFASLAQSTPPFVLGTLLLYLVAYRWGWLPLGGYGSGGWDRIAHLILPAMTIATFGVAYYARLVRSELLDVLGEDYVRTARAKGLPERAVIGRHALRNALSPVIALVGLELGVLLGGAVVSEVIFHWPGLGREVLDAILQVDIPVIVGVVLVSAAAIVALNLLVDLVQLWLDPRLRDAP